VVSTFGEGDPPDNATGLWDELREFNKSKANALSRLRYFVFGLGSTKYEQYNQFAINIDQELQEAGAHRVGFLGKCDVAKASDDGWMDWKEKILHEVSDLVPARIPKAVMSVYEPDIDVADLEQVGPAMPPALLAAELSSFQSQGRTRVYAAPMSDSRLLSAAGSRAYIHVEFDLSEAGPDFTYATGDHLAVWPMNTDQEVARLAKLFGWDKEVLAAPVSINAKSDMADVNSLPLGVTSREDLLRYYLDICGPVSSQTLHLLAHFAPTDRAKALLNNLIKDGTQWRASIVSKHLTYGAVMELADTTPNVVWPRELFCMFIQTMPRLQPRYFSISSSPLLSGQKISITAGVLTTELDDEHHFFGLTSNYLLALHGLYQNRDQDHALDAQTAGVPTFALQGHQGLLAGCRAQIHVRPSNFKPPKDYSTPMILVAAGSGVAPFLAFVKEREELAKQGHKVGRCHLFFGCRSPSLDYLYADTWHQVQQDHSFFSIETAFSRTGSRKNYVQSKLEAQKEEVARLIAECQGSLYICGSMSMAKAVKQVLVEAFVDQGLQLHEAEALLLRLKTEKRIQEDAW
jgi:NADPH-ferrihemoprotein reductase